MLFDFIYHCDQMQSQSYACLAIISYPNENYNNWMKIILNAILLELPLYISLQLKLKNSNYQQTKYV